MLPCLAPVLFTFKIQGVLKFGKGGQAESVNSGTEKQTICIEDLQKHTEKGKVISSVGCIY
jgi:hypothetical protein